LAKALHDYRAGRFAAALAASRAGLAGTDNAYIVAPLRALESLSCYKTNDAAGAAQALAEAKTALEKLSQLKSGDIDSNWHDALAARMLYDEAKALVEGSR
jgi:hypothetical protein